MINGAYFNTGPEVGRDGVEKVYLFKTALPIYRKDFQVVPSVQGLAFPNAPARATYSVYLIPSTQI